MSSRIIVLDANILIRAVLGNKVRTLITTHSNAVDFFTPDVCMSDARKYLPLLFEKRAMPSEPALTLLTSLEHFVQVTDESVYKDAASEAQLRMKNRDIQDWPIVATALTLNCPIWTEDQDFFGSGIPTWTTDRVHLFLIKLLYRASNLFFEQIISRHRRLCRCREINAGVLWWSLL